ncbi:MgtC/SapB family protein [Streptosporangium sp. NBC_01755]|uniref:MgtC/SapB family protein n=1 Tax=unclassified Streptosporangium TaxID=2632669 RepID=UPI002DD838B1|nr:MULTISPECIES: MgtC/SapB family protein [unclassified Streptosporangium]WSA28083.1 MgtC/SapB family protein [Streptosporangium sp. NBC_01810]WSD00444.1 MgtC/SapB family protein [Streptosporangium sp. NBC_01755]
MALAPLGDLAGQGWTQIGELVLAFVLSAAIGLEREIRQKSAGLRTHTLVGFAAALIMLVSKYGFADVLGANVSLDPSRVAAQIVSGIGFIGAGLIFVRGDAVRGLTTAAAIWLTAAVGMAAGAGLWLLAVAVTVGHFMTVFVLTPLADRLPRSRYAPSRLHLTYLDRRGVLRLALAECTRRGFGVDELSIDQRSEHRAPATVSLWLTVHGTGLITELTTALSEIDGVLAVVSQDANAPTL